MNSSGRALSTRLTEPRQNESSDRAHLQLAALGEGTRTPDGKVGQILTGARQVFLRDGFDGASMNDIAREAGVSKGTLYVYFPSKEALFAAYVRDDRRRQAEQIVPFTSELPVREALVAIGSAVMREMLAPAHVALVRTVVAAAAKFPEIGQAFYEAGPGYGQERFEAFLSARTDLKVADPHEAAFDFFNLVQGDLLKRALFRSETFGADAIDAYVARGVSAFLQLHTGYAKP